VMGGSISGKNDESWVNGVRVPIHIRCCYHDQNEAHLSSEQNLST
jgi:hypothetical protein